MSRRTLSSPGSLTKQPPRNCLCQADSPPPLGGQFWQTIAAVLSNSLNSDITVLPEQA